MDRDHKNALEKRHDASTWYGTGQHGRRSLKEFRVDRVPLRGWTLQRVREDAGARPRSVQALWGRSDDTGELLVVDAFVCPSLRAAHDQLFELLGNTQSDAIERRVDKGVVGDVTFALANTMLLFSRANVVVWVRNAGPAVVPVGTIAREVDTALEEQLNAEPSR